MRLTVPIRCLAWLALLLAPLAHAATPDDAARGLAAADAGLRQPERLTAGASDELLGSLAADGKTLFYVSNRQATTRVYAQALPAGTPRLVVDDEADVSFPRPGPDGRHLLYVSTRDDAAGDVCLRQLDDGSRRCLTGADTADVQAFWFPDGRSVGVVQRQGLHGDLRLVRVPVGGGAGTPLVQRNLSSPAVSPDGRWLAWVPVERATADVGVSFAMRLGEGLVLGRTGGGAPMNVRFDLPGATGFPAFSPDGRHLYFAQHLSDTNFDGRIDGDDHSVLFRVRFDPTASEPMAPSPGAPVEPEQLTSARWNCQYPAPAADRLVMTCHVAGSLDVYTLPLDGAVPGAWSVAKLQEALGSARDPWERLLLLGHLQRRDRAGRVEHLREITRLHLQLGEHASALFFAEAARRAGQGRQDVAGWADVVGEILGHRREERLLDRGRVDDGFVAAQRARLRRLDDLGRGAPDSVQALARLGQVEILDLLGDEPEALRRLEPIRADKLRDPFVLHAWADRGLGLRRELGQRDAVLQGLALLAGHEALDDADRLHYAERFVQALLRGAGRPEQRQRVAAWRTKVDAEGDLGFRLALEAALLELEPATEARQGDEAVRAAVYAHYRKARELVRRRALVGTTIERAAAADSALLLYEFANSWASWVPRAHAERPHALALYRKVVLERAWLRWREGKLDDARGTFYGLTLQADDLQAHAGFLDARRAEGQTDGLALQRKRLAATPEHPALRFAEAWELARRLPTLAGDDRTAARQQATALLDAAAADLARDPVFHHLRGWLAHDRLLHQGDRSAAAEAHASYLMAVDLARGDPRLLASLQLDLGWLQAAAGNHFLALDWFDQRARLPFATPRSELALRLGRARTLFHVGRPAEAAVEAERALALAGKHPDLARFRPLATDRAALYRYAAGDFARARPLYAELAALPVEADAAGRARAARAQLMLAATAAGAGDHAAALPALERAGQRLDALEAGDLAAGTRPYERPPTLQPADLAVIAQGLAAEAQARAGQPDATRTALLARRDGLLQRLRERDTEETLLELAETELRLAETARDRSDLAAARSHLEAGLGHAAAWAERTGTPAPPVRVVLALRHAELHLFAKVPLDAYRRQPAAELGTVHRALGVRPNPARAPERFLLGLYLTLLQAAAPDAPGPGGRG